MNQKFRSLVESLDSKLKLLLAMEPSRVSELPRGMPEKGIYLFSEGSKHLYVGRTDHLRKRLQRHGRSSSSHGEAGFAYQVARNECGTAARGYTGPVIDQSFADDPRIAGAFARAKERIRTTLEVRWIQTDDARHQALLEVYVHVALDTRFSGLESR